MYDSWLESMKAFQASMDKDVNEVRRYKDEIQKIKQDMTDKYNNGQYIRDEQRIVISAPEIVIGNVLKDGTLIPNETSRVIIRANNIQQEGVGTDFGRGTITNKATEIRNLCLDPGVDGNEEVVSYRSCYTVQAQSVALQSEETEGTFAETATALPGEIRLQADNHVSIAAMAPLENRKNQIEETIKTKNADKERFQQESDSRMAEIEDNIKELNALFALTKNLFDNGTQVRVSIEDIETTKKLIDEKYSILCKEFKAFQEATSKLAEANRQIKTLNDKKATIEETEKNVQNKQSTGASIDIFAENTNIHSVDANYKVCESENAGLEIAAKKVEISAIANGNGMLEDSEFNVNTQKIGLSTANMKPGENAGEIDMPAEGQVNITSRNIIMESVDKVYTPGETTGGVNEAKEKALTSGGLINMRAKFVSVRSQTTDGQAEGEFNVNSKIVRMSASETTESGNLSIAPKSYIELGYNQTRIRAKEHIIMDADKAILVHANEDVEIQQSFNKAALQLNQGNVSLKGENTKLLGKTTLAGETTCSANVEMTSATAKDLKVTGAISTPNSSEGTPTSTVTSEEAIELLLKLSELEQKTNELLKKSEEEKEQEIKEQEIKEQE